MDFKNMFKRKIENLSSSDVSEKISRLKIMNPKRFVFILILIFAVGGTTTAVYYFKQYRDLKANPNLEAQRETENLVASLGKLMELPAEETPTIATIADKDKLKDQPFFAKTENGDKLFAYTKAMQAILYRPSANKIINVAPIIINQQEGVTQNKPTSTAPSGLKIAYYNGTEVTGLSSQAEKAVKNAYSNYQTGALTSASQKDYKETLVIDLTGKYSQEASAIAQLLGGKASSLPDGETRPDADILVISGK